MEGPHILRPKINSFKIANLIFQQPLKAITISEHLVNPFVNAEEDSV